jgi:hypothetical protein
MTTPRRHRPRVSARSIVKAAGGPTKLLRILEPIAHERGETITSQAISNWMRRDRIGHKFVVPISELTRVPPYLIRPDIYPAPAAAAA